MATTRSRRVWVYLGVAIAGGLVLGDGGLLLLSRPAAFGLDENDRVLLRAVACALGMAWVVGFAALSFRNADEFKQQGSMVSWYWGGSLGLAVSAPLFVFIVLGGLRTVGLGAAMPPATAAVASHAFMLGYTLPIVAMALGFFAARLWWRTAKR